MAVKGQAETQSQYEKKEEFRKLLKEAFCRKEITREQVIDALKIINISANMASERVKEWSSGDSGYLAESSSEIKKRMDKLASMEKALLKNKFGQKKYKEYADNNEIKLIFN